MRGAYPDCCGHGSRSSYTPILRRDLTAEYSKSPQISSDANFVSFSWRSAGAAREPGFIGFCHRCGSRRRRQFVRERKCTTARTWPGNEVGIEWDTGRSDQQRCRNYSNADVLLPAVHPWRPGYRRPEGGGRKRTQTANIVATTGWKP